MRRFSQRNALVTLSEINITPLLDLAFVLLIIFVITRPMLEQHMNLKLPELGQQHAPLHVDQKDIRMVEISASGLMKLGGQTMNASQIERKLVADYKDNPNLVVYIRADKGTPWDNVLTIFDICLRHNITRVSPTSAPVK